MKVTFICVATHMKVNQMNSVRSTENVLFNQLKIDMKILFQKIIWLKKVNQMKNQSVDTAKRYIS